jgi:hypothetical protein
MKHHLAISFSVVLLLVLCGCQASPPQDISSLDGSIRTIRIDYDDLKPDSLISASEEQRYRAAGMNRAGIAAGRVDWAFFPWAGHSAAWAGPVRQSGINFLSRDIQRFGRWADITVVVDVLAPVYIQNHPEAAAVSWAGIPSTELVSLTQMTTGRFSELLLDFIDAAARVDGADSIVLVEMFYYVDGYGAEDLDTFRLETGLPDWPRHTNGEIDINAEEISTWRTGRISDFIERAAKITHARDKQLWLEVKPDAGQLVSQDWRAYSAYLTAADRLVIMGNPIFGSYDTELARVTVGNLSALEQDKILYEIGMWQDAAGYTLPKIPMTPEEFATLVQEAQTAGLTDFWFTPSHLMTTAHWAALGN